MADFFYWSGVFWSGLCLICGGYVVIAEILVRTAGRRALFEAYGAYLRQKRGAKQ